MMQVNPWLTQALLLRSQTLKKAVADLSGNNGVDNDDFASVLQSVQNMATGVSAGGDRFPSMTTYGETADRTAIDQIIAGAAERHGVPAPLVRAVVSAESDYQVRAVSAAGAQGLMQLMPATARSLGVTNSFDPVQNIDGGVRYLRDLLDRYQGDLSKVLAAYNAGPANVDRYQGIPPFVETQNYVNKIMANL